MIGLRAVFGVRKQRPGSLGSRRDERRRGSSLSPLARGAGFQVAAAAGHLDEGILRMAETEFDQAKKAGQLRVSREPQVGLRALCQGHTATTGEGVARKPASDAPVRRPSTPEKRPGAAQPAPSYQGKRKWDQSWSSGQGAQSAKWSNPRR